MTVLGAEMRGVNLLPGVTRRGVLTGAIAWAGLSTAMVSRAQSQSQRRSFFVSPSGNDNNTGSRGDPFATIGRVFQAISDLGAGDRIVVMPGVYQEAVVVSAGGDQSGNLRIISQKPHQAQIRTPANTYSAVNIIRNYVTFEGFDVQGAGTGHGIEATFLDGNNKNNGPHHITIRNNISHDNAGSGISLSYGDFYTIENNVCFNNCATNEYQGSGISVYAARAVDGVDGIRIIVRANASFDNMAIKLPGDVAHSDANGIIIDDLRNTQMGHPAGSYKYQTLVENNVCFRNGGKGVHIFISENVIVRNNTCCYNNRDPKNPATWRGDLSNVDSNNCLWVNNIGVADTQVNSFNTAILDAASKGSRNQNVSWVTNLTYSGLVGNPSINQDPGNPTLVAGAPYRNLFGKDPGFTKGALGEPIPVFRLRGKSPAVDGGTVKYGIADTDYSGNARVSGLRPDIGAYEYVAE